MRKGNTLIKKNKPMAPTILERGLPICGLRPNHICDFSNSSCRSFETWFIFYKMDCKSNAKPSEKNHDLPGTRTRNLWISSPLQLLITNSFLNEIGKV
jgi:hypothetical protein